MLFTDIEGSTRLLKQLGERYGDAALRSPPVASRGVRRSRRTGDRHAGRRVLRTRSPVRVTESQAAIEGQSALAAHEWPDGVECRVRMGLHTGEPSVGEEGYHGIGLHRGARIMSAAHGGQVLVSSATAELIQDDLPAGVSAARPRQAAAEGHRPPRAPLPARRRRAARPTSRRRERPRDEPARRLDRHRGGRVVPSLAAAAIAVIATRGGSGPPTASAAPISADSVGILDPRDWPLDRSRSTSAPRRPRSRPATARSGSRTSTRTASRVSTRPSRW